MENSKKKETLEQVAERILANNIDGLRDALKDDDLFFFYKGVVQCYGEAMAEWQKEQDNKLYRYEEVLQILQNIFSIYGKHIDFVFNQDLIKDLFEQYRKK
jgi:hypothetical protein